MAGQPTPPHAWKKTTHILPNSGLLAIELLKWLKCNASSRMLMVGMQNRRLTPRKLNKATEQLDDIHLSLHGNLLDAFLVRWWLFNTSIPLLDICCFVEKKPPPLWLIYPPPRNRRGPLWSGPVNRWFPLIRPAIKALFLRGVTLPGRG